MNAHEHEEFTAPSETGLRSFGSSLLPPDNGQITTWQQTTHLTRQISKCRPGPSEALPVQRHGTLRTLQIMRIVTRPARNSTVPFCNPETIKVRSYKQLHELAVITAFTGIRHGLCPNACGDMSPQVRCVIQSSTPNKKNNLR
jgi:hypothetical protein